MSNKTLGSSLKGFAAKTNEAPVLKAKNKSTMNGSKVGGDDTKIESFSDISNKLQRFSIFGWMHLGGTRTILGVPVDPDVCRQYRKYFWSLVREIDELLSRHRYTADSKSLKVDTSSSLLLLSFLVK